MKSTFKLIKRFIITLLLSVVLLILLNLVLLVAVTYDDMSNSGGWSAAEEIGAALTREESGAYRLSEEGAATLEERKAWAILIEDGTGNVIWHSDNLPEEVPMQYSAADISWITRGYIADYPTTAGSRGDDLVILGHPKTMYWKQMWNTYDYQIIKNLPRTILVVFLINIGFIFIIYMVATSRILRSVKPIVNGIESLTESEEIYIKEKGLLADLAAAINRVSEKLRMQERALKKKETARANWIAGVSHDIRTPLSMVMGYAGQLEETPNLPEEERKKAGIIRQESVKIKNLVNDLNLASKLEYTMQPVRMEPVNLVAVTRQVVVDFLNLDLEEKYPIVWNTGENLAVCAIDGDKGLIHRAVNNIFTNAQVHNPYGCAISVEVLEGEGDVQILIEDDGVGVSEAQLEQLRNTPHYMMDDGKALEQRHGLGLQIVRQIAQAHHGTVTFDHGSGSKGFAVRIRFPKRIE